MKVARIKKEKEKIKEKTVKNNDYSLKNITFVVIVLLTIFSIFYFITSMVLKNNSISEDNVPNIIDENKITVGGLLGEKEEEYFVLVLKTSKINNNNLTNVDYNSLYSKYINDYRKKENSLKVYNIYLDDALNANYLNNEAIITDDLNNIKFNDDTLLKIKNGSIEKYFIGNKEILSELSNL